MNELRSTLHSNTFLCTSETVKKWGVNLMDGMVKGERWKDNEELIRPDLT